MPGHAVLRIVLLAALISLTCMTLAGCSSNTAQSTGQEESQSISAEDAAAYDEASKELGSLASESMVAGDMPQPVLEGETVDLSEEETAAVDREIASQEPAKSASLFRNKAKHFCYRNKISDDERRAYDAIVRLCDTPKDASRRIDVKLSKKMSKSDAADIVWLAERAVTSDHGELFWLYNCLEGEVIVQYPYSSDGRIDHIYVSLSRPYTNYESEMKAFNAAVDAFMKGIDLTQTKPNIALQIHEKILRTASYSMKVYKGDRTDLGHTAYGLLVRNGYGEKNSAVCAGYAMAYVYLLQQAGITAAYVSGSAGDDWSSAEGHAWVLLKLGGEWYENDITWNDCVQLMQWAKDYYKRNPGNGAVFNNMKRAAKDEAYKKKLRHYMYNLTTSRISNYSPGDEYTYYFSDGAYVWFLGSSVHIRDCDNSSSYVYDKKLTKLLPKAVGTKYTFEASQKTRVKKTSGYVLADSATKKYTERALKKFDNHTLFLARNEIFARHGCGFENAELKRYFGSKTWYKMTKPYGTYSGTEMLNDIERHNALKMRKIERARNSPYL